MTRRKKTSINNHPQGASWNGSIPVKRRWYWDNPALTQITSPPITPVCAESTTTEQKCVPDTESPRRVQISQHIYLKKYFSDVPTLQGRNRDRKRRTTFQYMRHTLDQLYAWRPELYSRGEHVATSYGISKIGYLAFAKFLDQHDPDSTPSCQVLVQCLVHFYRLCRCLPEVWKDIKPLQYKGRLILADLEYLNKRATQVARVVAQTTEEVSVSNCTTPACGVCSLKFTPNPTETPFAIVGNRGYTRVNDFEPILYDENIEYYTTKGNGGQHLFHEQCLYKWWFGDMCLFDLRCPAIYKNTCPTCHRPVFEMQNIDDAGRGDITWHAELQECLPDSDETRVLPDEDDKPAGLDMDGLTPDQEHNIEYTLAEVLHGQWVRIWYREPPANLLSTCQTMVAKGGIVLFYNTEEKRFLRLRDREFNWENWEGGAELGVYVKFHIPQDWNLEKGMTKIREGVRDGNPVELFDVGKRAWIEVEDDDEGWRDVLEELGLEDEEMVVERRNEEERVANSKNRRWTKSRKLLMLYLQGRMKMDERFEEG
ncbi:hypothetical protein EJ08DRAFT_660061 [Tothia fuscella]|uniref:Uncharacterized protein n=1 Tax=Tothia fuscella TaxID=1048955 RepID=A0A9P4NT62_9PEZI|nr:hypothetical protein EJ08DRAFT_660061 [Tothia fuscella]